MGYAESVMDEISEYGRELSLLSFAAVSYISADLLHNKAHAVYGAGTPMAEVYAVTAVMGVYAYLGYLLTAALQDIRYVAGVGALGASSAVAVHYASHTVAGFQVPYVGSVMGALFAGGYLLYLYLNPN
jgi:hypothetical protein